MENKKFSLGVFVCVFNKDFSKILLLKRNEAKRKRSGADWGNVGGMVELGERTAEACCREAREEIGVILPAEKLKLIEIKETPEFSNEVHAIHFVYATTIDENAKITLNDESDEYSWFSLNALPEKPLDSKEDVIRRSLIAKNIFRK